MIIRNKENLLSHGNKKGREVALDVIEYAIKAVDANVIYPKSWDLSNLCHQKFSR